MRDLTAAGRAVVENPPAPPTPVDRIGAMARRRRRRHVRSAVAFATTVALIAGAFVVASDRKQSPPVGSVRPSQPPKRASGLIPPATPQMRAHLGVGVPKSWVPVDYGDARLWVPADWSVTAGWCPLRTARGWIELGGPYKETCSWSPASRNHVVDHVEVTPLTDTTNVGTIKQVINTYSVFSPLSHGPGSYYSVPALHVTIALSFGPTGHRVLQTLAPSARVIALDAAAQPVPTGWQRVAYGGISVAAPSSWPAQLVAGQTGPACEQLGKQRVWAGPPNLTVQCGPMITPPVPTDGVWLDHFPITGGGSGPSAALRGTWGSRVKVRLFSDPRNYVASTPELRLEVTVDEYSSELDVGLGRDGRIAKAILQSISASPGAGSGFTVGPARSGP